MTMSVRLSNDLADRHITGKLSGLSFRSVVPGGFASASFTLQSPIDRNDDLLRPFTRVFVYDQSGAVLWEGRLQIPGRSAGDQGEVWSMTAVGPSAHALDRQTPLVYIDRSLEGWTPAAGSAVQGEASAGTDPGDASEDEALTARFPNGVTVTTGSVVGLIYSRIAEAGLKIGGTGYTWDAGVTDANYAVQTYYAPSATVVSDNFNTAGGARGSLSVGGTLTVNDTTVVFRVHRTAGGATTIAADTVWGSIADWYIRCQLLDKTGTAISGAGSHANGYVLSSEVVADLLGRLLPQYDGANATITTGSVQIDQLAYPDGVTPSQVLDDLMALEPDMYWAAWESTNGDYRFEWVPWPLTVRYEATVADGFDAPAPSLEQYNRVTVRWKDPKGAIRSTTRTQTVDALTSAGITRETTLDLGDEIGSLANAQQAGDNFLAEHASPPNSGTLTVTRPVLDVVNGAAVQPWQLRPGNLIRVRGVEGSNDVLNASDRDGLTVFRIVSVECNDSGVATLELDAYSKTQERMLVDLYRRRDRRR